MEENSEGRNRGMPLACAACKLLRRRCMQDCMFAPYFPASEPHKFTNVHKVFGASNVNKMLQFIAGHALFEKKHKKNVEKEWVRIY